MERLVMNLSALYGDHHTTAIRRLLEPMEGVAEILASPASRKLVVKYYPTVVTEEEIVHRLADEGYVADSSETAYPIPLAEGTGRHTAILSGTHESMRLPSNLPRCRGVPCGRARF